MAYSKNSENEDLIEELNKIYGIENSKWKILEYVKYLEFSKKMHFANYNIIIHNDSNYPAETKDLLIEFLYKALKNAGIIHTGYEYIKADNLRDFEENKINNNTSKDKRKIKKFDIVSDLVIIDSERISRNLNNYKKEIIKILKKYNDKVFIIIDDSYCIGEINALFNIYFDWFFQIEKISTENKKGYINTILQKNKINVVENCNYIDKLIKEPLFIVKSRINHIILECKTNNITEIDDKVANKYFKTEKSITENNMYDFWEEDEKEICVQYESNLTFDSLVGINDIKEEISKIVNYVKICKKRKGNMPMLHMCFTGNPGTGKTTVARIIGKIFKEENILSKGTFVEIHGRDLVGRYIGWTAKEVKRHIENAKGGILFIDEAYSLNSDRQGSFEDEAIATLIKEMEDNRDDLCVILAGYKDETENLIKRNPGFESRIQFYIDFPNYSEDELYEIFKNLAKKENYKISSHLKAILLENFREKRNDNEFSNGRYVRNIYEKVKIEQANRVSKMNDEDIDLIKKCDIENILDDIKENKKSKQKIGFAV